MTGLQIDEFEVWGDVPPLPSLDEMFAPPPSSPLIEAHRAASESIVQIMHFTPEETELFRMVMMAHLAAMMDLLDEGGGVGNERE